MLITEKSRQQVILRALGDEISCKILTMISLKPESVLTIISKTGIPSSSVYRRIIELEEEGLIVLKHIIYTPKGKSVKIYKSVFKEISIKFKDEAIIINAVPNIDIFEKANRFFSVFKSGEKN